MRKEVVAHMINRDGQDAGTAKFTQAENGVIMQVDFYGLPEGEFAMHVHETGLATAPDFKDAGSHFNPTGAKHGIHSDGGPHIGDLPNIHVPASGKFQGTYVLEYTSLEADAENSLNQENGTTLIVHVGKDDYVSQPVGNAGDRQLAGVIFPKQN